MNMNELNQIINLKTNKMNNLESLSDSKFQKLSSSELADINGGWRLFGFESKYANQTLQSVGFVAATGDYGNKYYFGIKGRDVFKGSDEVSDRDQYTQ